MLSFHSGICHSQPQQQHTSSGKGIKLEANTEDPAPTAPAHLQNAPAPILPPLSPLCCHLPLLSTTSLLLSQSSCSGHWHYMSQTTYFTYGGRVAEVPQAAHESSPARHRSKCLIQVHSSTQDVPHRERPRAQPSLPGKKREPGSLQALLLLKPRVKDHVGADEKAIPRGGLGEGREQDNRTMADLFTIGHREYIH